MGLSSIPLENFHSRRVGPDAGGCPTPVVVADKREGKWMRLPCRRRRCPVCGERVWKPYVQAGLMSGLDGVKQSEILLVTLTAPGDASAWVWNRTASTSWNKFITYLRRAFPGARVSFWKVGELQERGAVHYHVVVRGLKWLPVEVLRSLAVSSGFGPWVWVGRPRKVKGGVKGLLGYYGKYMVKGSRAWYSTQHVVTHAQDWRQGWTQHFRKVRPDGSRLTSWSYCRSECDAYVLLSRAEGVKGADTGSGGLVAQARPLTPVYQPPGSPCRGAESLPWKGG